MTNKEMLAQIAALTAENETLKKQGVKRLSYKVSEKGGVSVYGLGRFPVTLYQTQWIRLLDISDELREFMTANADKLTTKDAPAKPKPSLTETDEDDLSPAQYRALVKSLEADRA